MNIEEKVEKTILSTQFVLFKIEALKHPYDKLPVNNPDGVIISDTLGFIRVPAMIIDVIKDAPLGGPITRTVQIEKGKLEQRVIELLFFTDHDVEYTDSFLEVLSEKISYAQKDHATLTVWAFIPEKVIPETAAFFLEKKAENILLYRSYDKNMTPYVLGCEKQAGNEFTENIKGFYCCSFNLNKL